MCVMASATREGAYSEFVLRFFLSFFYGPTMNVQLQNDIFFQTKLWYPRDKSIIKKKIRIRRVED